MHPVDALNCLYQLQLLLWCATVPPAALPQQRYCTYLVANFDYFANPFMPWYPWKRRDQGVLPLYSIDV